MAYKFFEDGYLIYNSSGSTTNGKVILRLQDISLSFEREVSEVAAFDTAWSREYIPTFSNWTVSASGAVTDLTSDTAFSGSSSGETKINGSYNGLQLLEEVKKRNTSGVIVLKFADDNYQSGNVILTSYEISASQGENMSFSLEMQGTGQLSYSAS